MTLDTRKTAAAIMGAGITSGSLFTGRFAFGEGSTTIEYTKFGVLYPKNLYSLKGFINLPQDILLLKHIKIRLSTV